ncbi:response regulator [Primorskyibacter sp. S187A]|uniref:response regulator n=1 Tax=Primorskyibacter sp. S187A TaxID=3415130 RepID=UPI003C7BD545
MVLTRFFERVRAFVLSPDRSGQGATVSLQPSGDCSLGACAIKPLKILLLEDDPGNVFVFQAYLKEMGCPPCDHAATLKDARAFQTDIENGAYDLVVFDIMLPDGESFALAGEVSQKTSTPVLAYTGRTDSLDVVAMAQAGFRAVLTKPLDYREFQDGLAAVLHTERRE